jgi:uncharacterized protein
MKFSQDFFTDTNRIHAYDEQSVTIQTRDDSELVVVSKNFIVESQQIIQDWPINLIADFTSDDVNYFNNLGIEVLLLSQNNTFSLASQLKPDVLISFSQNAIGVEQMALGSACRTYNLLISEGRQVALAVNF